MRVLPRSIRGSNSPSSLLFRKNFHADKKDQIMQKRKQTKYHPRYATIVDFRDMCVSYSIWNVEDSVRNLYEKFHNEKGYKAEEILLDFVMIDEFLKKVISMLGLHECGDQQLKPLSIQEMMNKDAQ